MIGLRNTATSFGGPKTTSGQPFFTRLNNCTFASKSPWAWSSTFTFTLPFMILAYSFAPGRRGESTQTTIDGVAACDGMLISALLAIASTPTAAAARFVILKDSPYF
jgi:type 1 fimbria pilin